MRDNKFFKIIKSSWRILVNAASGFADDKATKLSAALAYQTIFSLPPMLLLIIISAGTFYGQQAISGQLFEELRGFIGDASAMQIQEIMSKINFHKNSGIATVISAIVLAVGATGVFVEIQDSLNIIWGVRARPKKGILRMLVSRLLSFSMIIGIGFLLLVSLVLNAIIVSLSNFIIKKFPFVPVNMIDLFNNGFTFLVLAVLFTCVFKMLPDIKIRWKQVIPGALVTSVLFLLGKFLIGVYLGSSTTASLYGAAGSIIILLLWVYYSSFILYFGAEFTKAYIDFKGWKILPNSYAEYDDKIILKQLMTEKEEKAKELAASNAPLNNPEQAKIENQDE